MGEAENCSCLFCYLYKLHLLMMYVLELIETSTYIATSYNFMHIIILRDLILLIVYLILSLILLLAEGVSEICVKIFM